jgi:hypothetical protein
MKHIRKFNEKVAEDLRNIVDTIFVDSYDDGFTISLMDKFELSTTKSWYVDNSIPGLTLNITKWETANIGRRQIYFSGTEVQENILILIDYMKRKWGDLIIEYQFHTEIQRRYHKPITRIENYLPKRQIMRLWIKIRKQPKNTELKMKMYI